MIHNFITTITTIHRQHDKFDITTNITSRNKRKAQQTSLRRRVIATVKCSITACVQQPLDGIVRRHDTML
jgi:hypothetical protein